MTPKTIAVADHLSWVNSRKKPLGSPGNAAVYHSTRLALPLQVVFPVDPRTTGFLPSRSIISRCETSLHIVLTIVLSNDFAFFFLMLQLQLLPCS